MRLKKIVYVWACILCSYCAGPTLHAQDPHFSQFYANPLYLSPSLAGATDGGRFVMNYRNQWPAVQKAYTTYAVSFDNFFPTFNSGIGFYIIQDRAGSAGLTSTNGAFQYSYNLILNDTWQVIPGIQFEAGNKSIDYSKIKLGYESSTGGGSGSQQRLVNDNVNYFDLAASTFFYSSKYWMGLTVSHLARPNYTFMNEEMRLPTKTVVFGGMNIWTMKNRKSSLYRSFSWSFRYQQQEEFKQFDLGMYWHNEPLELGIWYRGLPVLGHVNNTINQDALIVLLAYNYGPYRFGYSYDITISGLGMQSAGAHEISLIYEFNQQLNLRLGGRRPAVPCSKSANPMDTKKYSKKRRSIF
jgi:type IX secretion system PorP/SprF family membrane protein